MAPLFKIAAILNLSLLVAAQGTQFITGACKSDADCASACCGFNSGKCAGPVVAQQRDGGCGFGDAQPNSNAAQALGSSATPQAAAAPAPAASAAAASAAAPPSATTAAKAPGTQFITGACKADADCASACCAFNTGKCAAPIVAQESGGGCGFGNAQPNNNALSGGAGNANTQAQAQGNGAATQAAAPAQSSTAPGTQFITGPCTSDADCAAGCCGFNTGKCAGAVVAQQRDGGCGFGNAQPNDNAAQALRGQRLGRRGVIYWM